MREGAARILLVDDDPELAGISRGVLERAGYDVSVAQTGAECVRATREEGPDLTILDFELPDMDAIEVLDQLRAGSSRTPNPVLILTGARHGTSDQVRGLEHGASDYLPKGLDRAIFLARVQAALRNRGTIEGPLRTGTLVVDPRHGTVVLRGRPVHMDRKPLLLLYELMKREGTVVTRDELLRAVWGTDYEGFERSVDQAVYSARKALGEHRWIQTVPGYGYRFRDLS